MQRLKKKGLNRVIGLVSLSVLLLAVYTLPAWSSSEYIEGTFPSLRSGKPFAGTTITVSSMRGWTTFQTVMAKISEFEEMTGIKVKFDLVPFPDLKAKQLIELASHTGSYDIVISPGPFYAVYPFLVPLNNRIIEAWGSIEEFEDYFMSTQKDGKSTEGMYYYVQMHANTQIGYYRKELFEDPAERAKFKKEYGYELRPPETMEQLHDVATFFTRLPKMYGLTMNLGGITGWLAFVDLYMRTGKDWVEKVNGRYECTFKKGKPHEWAVKIAKWEQDALYKYKYMNLDSMQWAAGGVSEFFLGGHAAIAWGWLSDYWPYMQSPEIKEKIGEVKTFHFPSPAPDPEGGSVASWGPAISKESRHPDAAWEFIKWVLQEPVQLAMASKGGQLPPFKEMAYRTSVDPGNINPSQLYYAYVNARLLIPPTLPMLALKPLVKAGEFHSALLAKQITAEEFVDRVAAVTEEALERAGLK